MEVQVAAPPAAYSPGMRIALRIVPILLIVAVVLVAGGFKAVDAYADWRWSERCVKQHADFCNHDGDGDTDKPWWAKRQ